MLSPTVIRNATHSKQQKVKAQSLQIKRYGWHNYLFTLGGVKYHFQPTLFGYKTHSL